VEAAAYKARRGGRRGSYPMKRLTDHNDPAAELTSALRSRRRADKRTSIPPPRCSQYDSDASP